jgi:hypothetical protein
MYRRGSKLAWCRIVYTCAPEISERNQATVAQKIQTLFIDDLDGSAAEGTVRFGLDGTEYEIDLNEEHAKELREALARYAGAARRASGAARRPARTGRRAPASGPRPRASRSKTAAGYLPSWWSNSGRPPHNRTRNTRYPAGYSCQTGNATGTDR